LHYSPDAPERLLFWVASGLWIVNSVYSIGYMRGNDEAHQTRFYACFALALAATVAIAFAANLLTLFLAYEMLTPSLTLVTHHGTPRRRAPMRLSRAARHLDPAAVRRDGRNMARRGYTGLRVGGIYGGSTTRSVLSARRLCSASEGCADAGASVAPGGDGAPTPVSALLHAVAVVKAGVFTVVKVVVYVFGVESLAGLTSADWLPTVAGFTILAASIVALRADNLKRRLAYSTVSQLSYVVLAASLLVPLSIVGAALHIAAHAVAKITLFFAAGAIYTAAHKTEVSELDGIGRRMPWTMGAFAVGAISMIGLPPTAGFVSKWFILSGAMAVDNRVAVGVIVVSTLLNAGYFLPIVYRAFFCAGDEAWRAPLPMVAALVITAR
jgi:multicomponent Na+:H+ antiporter subunit D